MWWLERPTIGSDTPSAIPVRIPLPTYSGSAPQTSIPSVPSPLGKPLATPPGGKSPQAQSLIESHPRPVFYPPLSDKQVKINLLLLEPECGHQVEIDRLVRDVESLEKMARTATKQRETLESELEENRNQHRVDLDAFRLQCDETIATQLNELGRQLSNSENTNDEFAFRSEQQLQEIERLDAEVVVQRSFLSRRTREVAELRAELDELRYQWADHVSQAGTTMQQLRDQRDEEVERLNAMLQTAEKRNQLQVREVGIARQRLAFASEELVVLKRKSRQDKANAESLEKVVAELQSEVEQFEQVRTTLSEQSQQRLVEASQLRVEVNVLRSQLESFRAEKYQSLAEHANAVSELRRQLSAALGESKVWSRQAYREHAIASKSTSELEQLRKSTLRLTANWQQQQVSTSRQVIGLEHALELCRAETETLSSQLDRQHAEYESERVATSEKISDLTETLQRTRRELEASEILARKATKQLQEMTLRRSVEKQQRLADAQGSRQESLQSKNNQLVLQLEAAQRDLERANAESERREQQLRFDREASESELVRSKEDIELRLSDQKDELVKRVAELDQAIEENGQQQERIQELECQIRKLHAQLSAGTARGYLLVSQYAQRLEDLRARYQKECAVRRKAEAYVKRCGRLPDGSTHLEALQHLDLQQQLHQLNVQLVGLRRSQASDRVQHAKEIESYQQELQKKESNRRDKGKAA